MNSTKGTSLFTPEEADGCNRSSEDGRRKGSREDETGSIAPHHIHKPFRASNVAADVAECLAESAGENVDLGADSVPFSHPCTASSVQPDGMHLVDEGEGTMTMGHVAQLLQGADGSGHGVDRFEGNNFWHVDGHVGKQ